ncbi:MAG: sigma-70 family RNA polymerase sigma factor [Clostridia bacterium]|jgi:DNA-directed RNA polymerase specialized sigma subunit|nr:sigma-70 family RNA polymerase sigma factor [Clostridia bacterium]
MTNYRVYIRKINTWVDVTKEQYYAYYRDVWATRKREQFYGRCRCPKSKMWICDGDCLSCAFRATGEIASLDSTFEDDEGNSTSQIEELQDEKPAAQAIMEDRELLAALYQKLEELDPDGRRICELIMEGKSERTIASELGISRSTYAYRRNKVLKLLREMLEPYFMD